MNQLNPLRKYSSFDKKEIDNRENDEMDTNMVKSRMIHAVPDLDILLNPNHRCDIVKNLVNRLVVPNENSAIEMLNNLEHLRDKSIKEPSTSHSERLNLAALGFPNFSHLSIKDLKEPNILFDNCAALNDKLKTLNNIRSFDEISKIMHGSRTSDTGQTTSEKSYYLLGPFAELEQALINYTVDFLTNHAGFSLVSVPDILNPEVIEACGFKTTGKRTNVFNLDPNYYDAKTLSGTSEMAFGSFFANKRIDFQSENVPVQKFAAVSRCYRVESAMGKVERGLYRVHHFTKVEMFALSVNDNEISDNIHQEILTVQQMLFDGLGLHYRVLDMHPGDLGAPASRKFDCEALLPGHQKDRQFYGEISSTSNCLDYQAR